MKAARRSRPNEAQRNDPRKRMMRAVLAACNRKLIDPDERYDIQEEITGKRSMSEMTSAELGKVLDHLNRDWDRSRTDRPHIAKIRALWWSLYWTGAIDEPGDKALDDFVQRQTGLSSLRFVDHRHAAPIIEAMKSWLSRIGVSWPKDSDIASIAAKWPGYDRQRAERIAVLNLIDRKVAGLTDIGFPSRHAARHFGISSSETSWNTTMLDNAIRYLGGILRRELAKEQ